MFRPINQSPGQQQVRYDQSKDSRAARLDRHVIQEQKPGLRGEGKQGPHGCGRVGCGGHDRGPWVVAKRIPAQ